MVTKEYDYIFSLSETYELKRQQHLADLQRKEDEMRQTFVIRVKEKEAQLKETEKEVRINEFSIPKLSISVLTPFCFIILVLSACLLCYSCMTDLTH